MLAFIAYHREQNTNARPAGLLAGFHLNAGLAASQSDFEKLITSQQKPAEHVDLSNADLRKFSLAGTKLDLQHANFSHSNLSGMNLNNLNLTGADLSYADLSGAQLNNTNLTAANLSHAILTNADMAQANLTAATVTFADLSSSNLQAPIFLKHFWIAPTSIKPI